MVYNRFAVKTGAVNLPQRSLPAEVCSQATQKIILHDKSLVCIVWIVGNRQTSDCPPAVITSESNDNAQHCPHGKPDPEQLTPHSATDPGIGEFESNIRHRHRSPTSEALLHE